MIVDANVLLRAFFPDEAQSKAQAVLRDHVAGRARLAAPALLTYEINNAVWQAERRGRISQSQAEAVLQAISGLDIALIPQTWTSLLSLARRFDRCAYDAAYLALAEQTGQPLLTGDLRLYNAVHPHLKWVLWIDDYIA